jgi:hypothetical protein
MRKWDWSQNATGAIMAANVLNSQRAIEASVYVVRAFVKMREVLATHKELVRRLDEMEGKVDLQFKVVFDAIRALMEPPKIPRRRIGYCPNTHFGYILLGQGGQ